MNAGKPNPLGLQPFPLLRPASPVAPVADDGHALWRLETARPGAAKATRRYVGGIKLVVDIEGYAFSWGSVAERQEPGIVVWEFYLENAIDQFESGGGSLCLLQLLLFDSLDARLDCVSRSFVVGCADPFGLGSIAWVIVPGGLANGILFSLVCKYPDSRDCREWLCAEFIPCILPEVVAEAAGRAVLAEYDRQPR
jgi:hypothetical protein